MIGRYMGADMERHYAEIILPDDASYETIMDARLSAKWQRMKVTDLKDKCGSCKYFKPKENPFESYGDCCEGHHVSWRQRTVPKCKAYERKDDD